MHHIHRRIHSTVNVRIAENKDIALLAIHHRKMFAEIWESNGNPLSTEVLAQLEQAYAQKLKEQLPDKTCVAWVIDKKETIVASGAVTIISFVPTPVDISHRLAYLHSIYTEKEHRGKQYAHAIIENGLAHCRQMGIKRIVLTASDKGRPIYHELGFRPAADIMRLVLD